jgi:hypothetical protein
MSIHPEIMVNKASVQDKASMLYVSGRFTVREGALLQKEGQSLMKDGDNLAKLGGDRNIKAALEDYNTASIKFEKAVEKYRKGHELYLKALDCDGISDKLRTLVTRKASGLADYQISYIGKYAPEPVL